MIVSKELRSLFISAISFTLLSVLVSGQVIITLETGEVLNSSSNPLVRSISVRQGSMMEDGFYSPKLVLGAGSETISFLVDINPYNPARTGLSAVLGRNVLSITGQKGLGELRRLDPGFGWVWDESYMTIIININEFNEDVVSGSIKAARREVFLNDPEDWEESEWIAVGTFREKPSWNSSSVTLVSFITDPGSESYKSVMEVFYGDGVRESYLNGTNLLLVNSRGEQHPVFFEAYDSITKQAKYTVSDLDPTETYEIRLAENAVPLEKSSKVPFFYEYYPEKVLGSGVVVSDKAAKWKAAIDTYAQETLGPRLERLALIEKRISRYEREVKRLRKVSNVRFYLDKRGDKEGRIVTSKRTAKAIRNLEKALWAMDKVSVALDIKRALAKNFAKMGKKRLRKEIALLMNSTSDFLFGVSVPTSVTDLAYLFIFDPFAPFEDSWKPLSKVEKELKLYRKGVEALQIYKKEIPGLIKGFENRKEEEILATKAMFVGLRSQIENDTELTEEERSVVLGYLNTVALGFEGSLFWSEVFN